MREKNISQFWCLRNKLVIYIQTTILALVFDLYNNMTVPNKIRIVKSTIN